MCSSASICQPADDHEEPGEILELEPELGAKAGVGTARMELELKLDLDE